MLLLRKFTVDEMEIDSDDLARAIDSDEARQFVNDILSRHGVKVFDEVAADVIEKYAEVDEDRPASP